MANLTFRAYYFKYISIFFISSQTWKRIASQLCGNLTNHEARRWNYEQLLSNYAIPDIYRDSLEL
jgi:hypothetical protein